MMSRDLTFYDRNGTPIAYTEDGEHIYTFKGKAVAYIYENTVYGFNGRQFGWFENGWIRDLKGACVFFSEDATGGPIKAVKKIKPIKGIKGIKPIKSVKQIKKIKPIFSYSWSAYTNESFFNQ
jgi:hypothetical protein